MRNEYRYVSTWLLLGLVGCGDAAGGGDDGSSSSDGSTAAVADGDSSIGEVDAACIDIDSGSDIGTAVVRGTTAGAGHDLAISCGDADEIVHLWTAPSAGRYAFDLTGTAYEAALAVLAADCTGEELACETSEPGRPAQVVIDADAGEAFAIVVSGIGGEVGPYVLSVAQDITGPQECADIDLGSAIGTSIAVGTTMGRGDDVSPTCASSGADVVHQWTAPAIGYYTFSLPSGSATLALFDDCDGAELACTSSFDAWYGVGVQLDEGESVLVAIDDAGVATQYQLAVQGVVIGECEAGDLGSAMGGAVASGSTWGAGDDVDASACGGTTEDEAWTWTAPYDGVFAFDTLGSAFDTVLEIRQNDCAGAWLGCNDEGPDGYTSRIEVPMNAGETVAIVIDGWSGSSGSYVLSIEDVGGQSCIDIDLGQAPGPYLGTTEGMRDDTAVSCAGFGGNDATIGWTPAASGPVTATVTGSPGLALAVVDGCGGVESVCGSDVDTPGTAVASFDALAGEPVVFVVDGGPFPGPFTFTIQ